MRHEHGVVLFHNERNELKSRITYIGIYYIVVEISKEHHNHISRHYVLYPLYSPELYLNTSINTQTVFKCIHCFKTGEHGLFRVWLIKKIQQLCKARKYCIKKLPLYTKITNQDFRCNQRCFCLTLLN